MMSTRLARLRSGRVHYAWVVLAVMFTATLAGVGVRAAPGVMIVPLEHAFGWDVSTISGAISLNIILLGATGPFMTGLMQVIGLKRTILLCLALLMTGTGLSTFMTAPWQLFLTWGLMVGIGAGAGAVGMAAAIANRWFARRTSFAMGLLTAANAAGQLIFLPLLAMLAEHYGWRAVAICVTLGIAVVWPIVALALPESPAAIGLAPYGATAMQPPGMDHAAGNNPFSVAINALVRGSRSVDFWLLCLTFGICGFSTNGLINTHLIAYCADHGIAEVNGASILAVIGVFSLIGSALSGWMCDRFNPRVLLFWYYGLRGLSLVLVPFTSFDSVSLSVFAVFYGLDWLATVPPTVRIANEAFGDKNAPLVFGWVVAGHQLGAACAAFFAGFVRSAQGDYLQAFMIAGATGIVAAVLSLMIGRRPAQPVLAAA